jgi:hypothetical protein
LSRCFNGTGDQCRFIIILKAFHKIVILFILQLVWFQNSLVAQDTLTISRTRILTFKAEPLRATMLAIALPGLGQIYNKKYWKVPIVYAGFGGLIYAIDYNTREYNRFMQAYQDFTDKIPETNSYIDVIKNVDPSTYDPVLHPDTYNPSSASWYEERMLRMVDYFKKNRDLSFIGIAAWYLVTILDANVDASLFNYDISDNLNLAVGPVQMPLSGQAMLGLNVSLKVTF